MENFNNIELLQTLSLAAFIAAGVFLLVAIALFFLLDIRKVFGDISGTTAKKAIENIRQQNEATGDKAYKPSPVNAERGKTTDKISPSGRLLRKDVGMPVSAQTEKFKTDDLKPAVQETSVLGEDAGETSVLGETYGETALLGEESGETSMLSAGMAETTLLYEERTGETAVLYPEDGEAAVASKEALPESGITTLLSGAQTDDLSDVGESESTVEYEIGFIGSTEIIE